MKGRLRYIVTLGRKVASGVSFASPNIDLYFRGNMASIGKLFVAVTFTEQSPSGVSSVLQRLSSIVYQSTVRSTCLTLAASSDTEVEKANPKMQTTPQLWPHDSRAPSDDGEELGSRLGAQPTGINVILSFIDPARRRGSLPENNSAPTEDKEMVFVGAICSVLAMIWHAMAI